MQPFQPLPLQEAEQSMPDSAPSSAEAAGVPDTAGASAAADASGRQHPQGTWQPRTESDQINEEHAACKAKPPHADLQAAQTQCFVPGKAATPAPAQQQPELPASGKPAMPGPAAEADPPASSKHGVPGADGGGKPEAGVAMPSQEPYLGFKPPLKPQMQRRTALAAAEAARLVASTAVHASRVSLQLLA